ncbi:MAG: hypothetical protein P9E67_09470 [Candidatus Competibacter sp.]|nr:hypothetical protein [Candidatus Competibacter sp.]
MIDFKQPSTWRGIVGRTGLIGWALSPELREHIAQAVATLFALIEIIRNEYRDRPAKNADADGGPVTVPRCLAGGFHRTDTEQLKITY